MVKARSKKLGEFKNVASVTTVQAELV
jgi:hypothetical protein